ncbi:unnamed protein product [Oikopleura dioica]|uniref:Uncharacterized protein n=1 Tax=Oikopleura dioica TaxID=34765 RepID=E4XHT4_OIKDI|nr:unnamed protein product [Oikopleura dioica]
MRSVQRIRKVGIVPLYQPQHNFILNYIRKQGARTKMGIFNAKDKYNVESMLQQMGWTVPDFDLPTMKEGTKFGVHLKCPQNLKSPRFLPKTRTFSDQQKMF